MAECQQQPGVVGAYVTQFTCAVAALEISSRKHCVTHLTVSTGQPQPTPAAVVRARYTFLISSDRFCEADQLPRAGRGRTCVGMHVKLVPAVLPQSAGQITRLVTQAIMIH